MNKMFLMRNPELFQGEKYINANKNYFEGWYFKNTNNKNGIAFIPGININGEEKKAFIQIITNNYSYFVNYSICDFKFSFTPFYIKIGDNFFSKERIHIDIKDETQNLRAFGDIKYSNCKIISSNFLNPNIMGPFSYIPFMECNHAILSMNSRADGLIDINSNKIKFDNDIGYIEKDWGCSFPKSYIWCQGNNFQNPNASFMISIAHIPFKTFSFRGFICDLIIDNNEFKFATYNNAKLIKYNIDGDILNINIRKGNYYLDITSKCDKTLKLSAPVKGKMEKDIFESITSTIKVTLMQDDKTIFSDISTNCGLEIVV